MTVLPELWRTQTLDEVVELRRGFDLPTHSRREGPFPVLSAGVTAGWHDEGPIKGPGLVVGRATNLGVPTWSEGDFWPLNTTLYAADFHGNSPRFVFHLFESMDLSGFDSGSVQPMLNRNYIAKLKVAVPPLSEQRAIAEVLGALDDKIAANRKLVETADQLASSLFRDAAAQGSVEVELREVAELITRGVAPKYTEDETELLVLNQKCVRDQRVNLGPARRTLQTKVPAAKRLRANDVLVNSTGAGTLGRVARWVSDLDATVDSHVSIVRFGSDRVDPVCAGFAVLHVEPMIEMMGEGSTGQTELSRDQLGKLRLRFVAREREAEVSGKLAALTATSVAHIAENGNLATLRDTLLPRLMSGELRVRDAEHEVEEVL
ncbi:Restriction modification system DNA specificity domain [Rhodococcus sp. RD6.2]|uniref:restriction endonuclease subunit S n=1 Tax=Rhodococcus sp. RD6.2 TaxID=260936 RepID=UPI00063BC214|nr:restriction endonuclease subunit S [Rhodococcus sp. RD6.2]CRK51699.1 Restriction modification system DNA specificity domain [Rhodococcus sp. RD6.2]